MSGTGFAERGQDQSLWGAVVTSTSQADTPRLTLVPSVEPAARQPVGTIDPVRFLQSIMASLELDALLHTLSEFLAELVGQSGWEYQNSELGVELSGGRLDRHRLEYALSLNDQEMGTLKLARGRRFSDLDQARIESLLGLAAPALRNAIRFQGLSQQLERDVLTGLGNRRAFYLQGGRWLADAIRQERPLSMLLMDLDSFKSVNDRFGHPVGDRLLCALADTLVAATRGSDLCVRMGGDEFSVLLPGTDLVAAMECAERIRRSVARLSVDTEAGGKVSATVSIGVATYRSGLDLELLYRQSDEALYAAKRAGCNRVLAGTSGCLREELDPVCTRAS